MILKEFVRKYKIDLVRFSIECGSRPSSLYQYMSGKRVPRQEIAENIEKASDGLVTVREQRGCDDRDKRLQKLNELERNFEKISREMDDRLSSSDAKKSAFP